jgi:hypothetical protein
MEERTALKRRGILAAAGAAIAGIVAKRASEPVAAASTANAFVSTGAGAANGDFDAQGSATYGFRAIDGTFQYGVYGTGSAFGVVGTTSGGTGVSGGSTTGIAVFGLTASDTEASVEGRRLLGAGPAVLGSIYAGNSVANTNAVIGNNQSVGTGGNGVYGTSAKGYGVLGYTTGGSASVSGISTNANIPAFAGGNAVAGGLAAAFAGTVFVSGKLIVSDPSYKSGLLAHPDGSHRLVYCVESPESWIEDFGTGQLTNGRADIRLDPDFAAVVQLKDYHVFLSEYDGNSGLYVTNRTASGFTVQAERAGSGGAFSWRMVAKPKTDKKAARLAKFAVPTVTLPDPSMLPKPSEPPKKPILPPVPPLPTPPMPPTR